MIKSEGHHIYQLAKVAAEATGAAVLTARARSVMVRRYFFMAHGYKLHSDKQCLLPVCCGMSNSQILLLLPDALHQSHCRRHACKLLNGPKQRWLLETRCILSMQRCDLSAYSIATAVIGLTARRKYIVVNFLLECCLDSQLRLTYLWLSVLLCMLALKLFCAQRPNCIAQHRVPGKRADLSACNAIQWTTQCSS